MDFSLNTEQQMLQSTARKFAADILPSEARLIEDNDIPQAVNYVNNLLKWGFWGSTCRHAMAVPV